MQNYHRHLLIHKQKNRDIQNLFLEGTMPVAFFIATPQRLFIKKTMIFPVRKHLQRRPTYPPLVSTSTGPFSFFFGACQSVIPQTPQLLHLEKIKKLLLLKVLVVVVLAVTVLVVLVLEALVVLVALVVDLGKHYFFFRLLIKFPSANIMCYM